MKSPSLGLRILASLVAVLLLALSGGMAWAAAHDFEKRTFVPEGVKVVGSDLSGMTEAETRDAIEAAVAKPLLRPLTVVADEREFEFDPASAIDVDVDAMVDEAFAPRRGASFVARVRHDLDGVPLPATVTPRYSVDTSKVAEWMRGVAKQVDMKAVNATLSVETTSVVIKPSKSGRKTAVAKAVEMIAEAFQADSALAEGERTLTVPVKRLKPKVTEKDLPKTIVVRLSERRIRLFDGGTLEKTYPCAIGTPGYPTPTGVFEVTLKRYLPTWVNPAPNGWGKDMPAMIPPGPSNPLGTRAINLSASGIRFHGTNNISSIGTAASHGCMRMYRGDIEDFYERVEVGTKVYIFP